jgi:hypothetical protein
MNFTDLDDLGHFLIMVILVHMQSVYASKVEVQDYKLLCLADIEVRDDKFTLVGIFCTWWTLPSWEACSLIGRRIFFDLKKHFTENN